MPDPRVEPFTLDVPEEQLEDLRRRLAAARLPEPLPGEGWDRGVPVAALRELLDHWQHGYDWRTHERAINVHPQFVTRVDDVDLHFLHVRSTEEGATPLLLLHGWPGSFVEFLDLVEPLVDPAAHGGDPAAAFHVVVPSLPGFGLSGSIGSRGWTEGRMAGALVELMDRLGYERFGVQGGDLGAVIAPAIGHAAPDRVIGVHVNAATVGFMPFHEPSDEELASLSEVELGRLARIGAFMGDGFGYAQIMGTRPQTLAYALTDSPVGQLAWIAEKFHEWTGDDEPWGGIDPDTLLTDVMLYWLTGTAASSANVYWEGQHAEGWGPDQPSGVPTGVLATSQDVAIRQYAEPVHDIVRWTDTDEGGHFAALEVPGLLVAEVRAFFGDLA